MNILVTGGAGYIGSHVVRLLAQAGCQPIILDDFRSSKPERTTGFIVEPYALEDEQAVREVFDRYRPKHVIHLAGLISVSESVRRPEMYWCNNVLASNSLLRACEEFPISTFVFSSSAAVYGDTDTALISENMPTNPTSPYGQTKLTFENMLHQHAEKYGYSSVALRYFNASGCHPEWQVGEDHDPEEHLIPSVIRNILNGQEISVFGSDYHTDDGTCVRDFVHVMDIARAHAVVLQDRKKPVQQSLNIGSGNGYSVAQLVHHLQSAMGKEQAIQYKQRRPGDPARLVADTQQFRTAYNWKPKYSDLNHIVSTAISWELLRQQRNQLGRVA